MIAWMRRNLTFASRVVSKYKKMGPFLSSTAGGQSNCDKSIHRDSEKSEKSNTHFSGTNRRKQ